MRCDNYFLSITLLCVRHLLVVFLLFCRCGLFSAVAAVAAIAAERFRESLLKRADELHHGADRRVFMHVRIEGLGYRERKWKGGGKQ